MLQQLIDEVVAELGQLIALVRGLGDSWPGESINLLPHLHHCLGHPTQHSLQEGARTVFLQQTWP